MKVFLRSVIQFIIDASKCFVTFEATDPDNLIFLSLCDDMYIFCH